MVKMTGKVLNERWGIGAHHALYREDGIWYHVLERFPGALCDNKGYVVFETKDVLDRTPGIILSEEKNWLRVPKGIHSLQNYVRRDS